MGWFLKSLPPLILCWEGGPPSHGLGSKEKSLEGLRCHSKATSTIAYFKIFPQAPSQVTET